MISVYERITGHRRGWRWQRGRLTALVDEHHLGWDLVSGALTIIYVVLAFRQDYATALENYAIWALAILFLAEFGARCYDAPNRVFYLRSHWLDLITAVPVPGIPGLRVLRLVRLLRFMKVGMILRRRLIGRGWADTSLIWPTLVLFWIASGLALWLVEHDAPGASIRTFPEAMTAAFMTASTLGLSGARQKLATPDAQIISGLIVFMALGLWGFASSRLTQIWLQGRREQSSDEIVGLQLELRSLRDEVAALVNALTEPVRRLEHTLSSARSPAVGDDPPEAGIIAAPENLSPATSSGR
jgi:hypothetical protein